MMRLFAFLLIAVALSGQCFGQEYVEDENWLKGFHTEADYFPTLTYWQLERFTLEDIANGKQRLNSIRKFVPQNEWEGLYYANTPIGDDKFIWNAQGGFFRFYFYHTLKVFYFGRIKDYSGFIELDYEKLPLSRTGKPSLKTKLVKARIDQTHFLVPENRLQDFCDRAAGLSTSLEDFYYYWTKEEDMKMQVTGLPILPAEYEKYRRYPIEAEIIRVGARRIIRNENRYTITLSAGKNRNLRKGMNFFVKDLGEWIRLTRVSQKSSAGVIIRDFDENNQEECRDDVGGMGESISCKEIRVGMEAKTKGDL